MSITDFSKSTVRIVELVLDRCVNDFGVSPCTASGSSKCYRTKTTCKDVNNFDTEDWTIRLIDADCRMPSNIEAHPCILNISEPATQIDETRGLSAIGNVNITVAEFPCKVDDLDPYFSEREQKGHFWRRLKAITKHYEGRTLRIYDGCLEDDGTFDVSSSDTEKREYVITAINGPTDKERVTITAKEPFEKLKVNFPLSSSGELYAAITDSATTLTVSGENLDAEYLDDNGELPEKIEITSSSEDETLYAWKLFDRQWWTAWRSDIGSGDNSWVTMKASRSKTFNSVDIQARQVDTYYRAPSDFAIEYSDDGSTWATATSATGLSWYESETKSFSFTEATAKYWRITIYDSGDAGNTTSFASLDYKYNDEYVIRVLSEDVNQVSGPIYIKVEDEYLKVTERSGTGNSVFTVVRGQLGTTAAAHDAEEAVNQIGVLDGNPAELWERLLLFCDIPSAQIDTTGAATEETAGLNQYDMYRIVAEPTQVTDILRSMLECCLSFTWWDAESQTVKLKMMRPTRPDETLVTLTDLNLVGGSRPTPKENVDKRITCCTIHYDIIDPAGDKNKRANYRYTQKYIDLDAESEYEYGQRKEKVIWCPWFTYADKTTVFAVATRWVSRYRTAPTSLPLMIEAADAVSLKPGQLVAVKTAAVEDASGDNPTVHGWIRGKKKKSGHTIIHEAQWMSAGFAQRFAFWAPESMRGVTYSTATDEQKAYGFFANNDGKMPDGAQGYGWQ